MIRDLWFWWKARTHQLSALALMALIVTWMSLSLWQSERHFRSLVNLLGRDRSRDEAVFQKRFNELLRDVQGHLDRQDRQSAVQREEQVQLRRLLGRMLDENEPTPLR
jgi:hypothetical protein